MSGAVVATVRLRSSNQGWITVKTAQWRDADRDMEMVECKLQPNRSV